MTTDALMYKAVHFLAFKKRSHGDSYSPTAATQYSNRAWKSRGQRSRQLPLAPSDVFKAISSVLKER